MTVEWHGYPQHPDAHPERPWWRAVAASGFTQDVWPCRYPFRAMRSDGLAGPEFHAAKHDTADQPVSPWAARGISVDALVAIDAEHPLPAPPPKCGQVWRWLDADGVPRDASMVIDIEYTEALFASGLRCDGNDPRHWPPPGAVLVAGPHSPWSPQ